MEDGSTDKNGKEIEGFAVRYIDMEKMRVKEHCIDIVQADDRSASGIMSVLLESARKIDRGRSSIPKLRLSECDVWPQVWFASIAQFSPREVNHLYTLFLS